MNFTLRNSASLTPLEQLARQTLVDRTERYRADLTDLLRKCRQRGYVSESTLVTNELGKLSRPAPVSADSKDFAELFRMRSRYNRDQMLVLGHLHKSPAEQHAPSIGRASFFWSLMAWLASVFHRANVVASRGSKTAAVR